MMDASYDIQIATVGRLKAFASLVALIGDRVYDSVPRDSTGQTTAKYPYVSFGPEQVVPDDYECIPGSEIFFQIDVWSQGVGFVEAKKIANEVRLALHNFELPLTENALVSLELDSRQLMREGDGKTSHAALTFKAVVEHD